MRSALFSVTAVLILACTSPPAAALEPLFVEGPGTSWVSVQGNTGGNPVTVFLGDLTGGGSARERFVDVPAWIVSGDFDGDRKSEAAVLFADGTLRILVRGDDRFRTLSTVRKMAPESPPVVMESFAGEPTGGLVGVDDRGDLVSIDYETGRTRRLASGFSSLSFPVAADLDGDGETEIAAVSDEGFLTVIKGRIQTRSDTSVRLLPDTRVTATDFDGDGVMEIAALSTPTDELSPGRLGDDLEARGLAVYNWDGRSLRLKADHELDEGQVFEGLNPLIAAGEDGGDPLLMLTVTEKGKGSQIRSYTYNRGRLRESRKGPVSREGEWIHVLGSAVLGGADRPGLLAALLPTEDGGSLELYRLDLAQTRITLSSAIGSHQTGSRRVESVLIGDMDRDGLNELLAPGRDRSSLVLFSLDRNRLKSRELVSSSGRIGTNLCPGDYNGDGASDVLFGMDDGTLMVVWGK